MIKACFMKCPVCGMDCARSANDILAGLPRMFLPCADCSMRNLDKRAPLPSLDYAMPCSCGKRFIDEVFAHMYVIMVEEGVLKPTEPLLAVGSPLIHPGFAMDRPPFLPDNSLVLLSSVVTPNTAERLKKEVPELRGVIKKGNFIPGIADPALNAVPKVYKLLAGCDVRADLFPLPTGQLVMYKQQSVIHIEFPRGSYPKLRAVEKYVGKPPVPFFIDACSGIGTLGLSAACMGVPHVILNDAWYASAFWSAFNLEINRQYLNVERVRIYEQINDMQRHPVTRQPIKIASTEGEQVIEVYQGDFRCLPSIITPGSRPVTVFDLFEKNNPDLVRKIIGEWKEKVGGITFIP